MHDSDGGKVIYLTVYVTNLSCDYLSVTPVFRTESMLLLKFTCIFLKAPSRKHFFPFSHDARSLGTGL